LDIDELAMGTDPLLKDTDGDGYNDGIDEYPLDSTKWKKEEKAHPEDNIWLILIAIMIIVIVVIVLIFLFVIKPRIGQKDKGVQFQQDQPKVQPVQPQQQLPTPKVEPPAPQVVQPQPIVTPEQPPTPTVKQQPTIKQPILESE
ncbi:MAG: hypothetical protein KAJ51_01590, partial [Thermoplasmata archaeon]|nr:hypothetical protein [Thermoplasmata archaeon]